MSSSNNKVDFAYLEQLNQLCLKNSGDSKDLGAQLKVLKEILPGEEEEFYNRLLNWCPNRISKLPDIIKEFPYLSSNFEPPKCSETTHTNLVQTVISDLENQSQLDAEYFKSICNTNQVPFKTVMSVMRRTLCGVEVIPHPFCFDNSRVV